MEEKGNVITDYRLFLEILTQLPQRSYKVHLIQSMRSTDLEQLSEKAGHHFDEIMSLLKSIPNCTLLVLRNINTIRSIARGHGDPIDRYKVMARCATEGSFRGVSSSLLTTLINYKDLAEFEIRLWWGSTKMKMLNFLLHAMIFLKKWNLF